MAQGRFVVPLCLDFGSWIYGRALFNFQGPDFVRDLFYFADGRRIGAEGLRQLKISTPSQRWLGVVAGLADGHDWDGAAKPSRLLLEEREAWCDSNMARIRALSAAMTRGEYPDLPAKLKKPVPHVTSWPAPTRLVRLHHSFAHVVRR